MENKKQENPNKARQVAGYISLVISCILIIIFYLTLSSKQHVQTVSSAKQQTQVTNRTKMTNTTSNNKPTVAPPVSNTTTTNTTGIQWSASELKHGSNKMDFYARPSKPSALDPKITSYFYMTAQKGQTMKESLVVENGNTYSITVHFLPVQAYTGLNGGIVYQNVSDKNTWIHGLPTKVTLPAKTNRTVSFSVVVPKNTSGGDHIFGIDMQDHPPVNMDKNQSSKVNMRINGEIRRVMAVYTKIPAKQTGSVTFGTGSVISYPSGMYLDIKGFNSSNTLLKNMSGTIGLFKDGKKIWSRQVQNVTLMPNQPFEFQYKWQNGNPSVGNYQVRMSIANAQIKASTSGLNKPLQFSVTPTQLKHYQSISGTKVVQSYIPVWIYIVIGIVLLALIFATIFIVRLLKQQKKNDVQEVKKDK